MICRNLLWPWPLPNPKNDGNVTYIIMNNTMSMLPGCSKKSRPVGGRKIKERLKKNKKLATHINSIHVLGNEVRTKNANAEIAA